MKRFVIVLSCVAAAVLGACSSSGGTKSPTSQTGSGAGQSSADAAKGTPVKIGYINVEGPAVSQVWIRVGAEATVKYINSQLGGIARRPIDLDMCKTLGTAETTTSCANNLIADHVSAVLIGAGGGFAPLMQINGPTSFKLLKSIDSPERDSQFHGCGSQGQRSVGRCTT